MEIFFTVPGEPVPQGRPKFTTKPFVRAYDPPKSAAYKKLVAAYASRVKPTTPLEGDLFVKIDVYKGSLKSFSKKKLEQAEAKSLRPRTKPDADNYAKGPLDACKGILWKDDGQVVDLLVSKYYSKNPRIEIRIQEVDSIQETLF
ncbi:RusA family crossover junction endodeoxyribonuclease [Enterococcus sp.]|jgi:Holliday junction resolvase RusA-like endonuclease|uniref:RusA family crossover junction endodeoxyribonuclease n=1 Tax=unclassified Enterococcus TaxID=2608891 RepID=UPI0028A85409|nr:RusA family crossover junction endodeoxyribonuclease [Enterococcus sp.]